MLSVPVRRPNNTMQAKVPRFMEIKENSLYLALHIHTFMLVAYICIHGRFSFVCRKCVCRKTHIPYHIILLTLKNTRQSYFFAHKEIKKSLQLPEILSLLKARK